MSFSADNSIAVRGQSSLTQTTPSGKRLREVSFHSRNLHQMLPPAFRLERFECDRRFSTWAGRRSTISSGGSTAWHAKE